MNFNKYNEKRFAGIACILLTILIAIPCVYFNISYSISILSNTLISSTQGVNLIFSNREEINFKVDQDNQGDNGYSIKDNISASVSLALGSEVASATEEYNVYFYVMENQFTYTTASKAAEVVLNIYDNNGSRVILEGLTQVSYGESVGYDITTFSGLVEVASDYVISGKNNTTHNWIAELVYLDVEGDQVANASKSLNAKFLLQGSSYNQIDIVGSVANSSVDGDQTTFVGMDKVNYAMLDYTVVPISKNDSDPWVMNPATGIHYMLFDVSSDYVLEDHSEVEVTVEYLDSGTGSFNILYNSLLYKASATTSGVGNIIDANSLTNGVVSLDLEVNQDNNRASEAIVLQNTMEWKSITFILENTAFTNALYGYDFAINNTVTGREYAFPQTLSVRNVSVQSVKKMEIVPTDGKLNYSIVDLSTDEIIYTSSEEIDMKTSATQNFTISTEIDKNSSYEIKFDIKGSDGELDSSLFSVMPFYDDTHNEDSIFGVCTHYGLPWFYQSVDDKSYLQDVSNTGWIRDEVRWSEVEKVKGVLEIPAITDEYINAAVNDGIEPLLILAFGNSFYDDGGPPYSVEGLAAFEAYITEVVTHFKGRVSHFEIWNEYNLSWFNTTNRPPEDYVELLEVAYTTIKSIIPDATVIGGAMALENGEVPETWFRDVLEAGALNYMDAVSYHPYSTVPEYGTFYKSINELRNIMSDYGAVLPIWVTEIGWPVTDKQYSATERQSAEYLARTYVLGTAAGVDKIFWYDLINDGSNSSYEEHNFGLLRSWDDYLTPLAAKLPFLSYNTVSNQLSDLEFVEFLYEPNTSTYPNLIGVKFRKKNSNESVIVAWSTFTNTTISLNYSSTSVTVTDIYSNSKSVSVDNGTVRLDVTSSPIFIEGVIS